MPEQTLAKTLQMEMKAILDITVRVDERMKLINEKQVDAAGKLNSLVDHFNTLTSRVSVIEAKNGNVVHELKNKYDVFLQTLAKKEAIEAGLNHKIETFEKDIDSLQNMLKEVTEKLNKVETSLSKIQEQTDSVWSKIKMVMDLCLKAGWAIIVAYLIYKLGLSSPPKP